MTPKLPVKIFSELVFLLLLILFVFVFIINAWVVDDAYITFRTVDNFVKGYGLTWNVSERVQVYTHPLWMFVISFFTLFSKEVFYTSIAVSLGCCLGMICIFYFSFKQNKTQSPWKPGFLILLLLASKAFIDFTSSGLENPLSYLIAALFFSQYLLGRKKAAEYNIKDVFFFFFTASLAFINRQDTIIFYFFPLVHIFIIQLKMKKWTSVLIIPAAVIPALFWFFFSLFYYGFLFPNTAYAKYMLSDISFMEKIEVGITYFKNSIHWDWASHLILLCALVLALVKKEYKAVFIMCGVLCYLFFVLTGAAAATHMSGRFFALPFFISICLFTCLLDAGETAVIVSLLISLFIIVHPLSSIKMGTEWYIASKEYKESIDTKWYAHKEGAALINYKQGKELPDHTWYKEGKNFKKRKEKIHLGGPGNAGGLPIGFFGFAAGQEKYIIDIVALSDPLRARLPVTPNFDSYIRSGHFFRIIPEGYIQSIRESENLIKDKDLSVYYGKLLNIITSPLFSAERIKDIIDMNLGKYQSFLDAYISRIEKVYKDPQMINVLLRSAGPVGN